MSRIQDPQKAFFPHGNPFRMILPKGSSLSPKLLALLNKFEETLAERLRQLKPVHKEDVFSFSWMVLAMKFLSETHNDIISLITDLELPVHHWDDKWIDVYLDNSVKLLDISNGFSSELSRLNQGQLLLHLVLHRLEGKSSTDLSKAKSSVDSWKQLIATRNPKIENCITNINKLLESLEFPKVKNSAKGKVLMRAMYGVKMATLFICSIFVTAFTGFDQNLIGLKVSGTPLWEGAFNDLQASIYGEIRNLVSSGRNLLLKELEAVDIGVMELYPMIQEDNETAESDDFQKSFIDLGDKVEKLSSGLDLLTKEVDGFFQIVMSGRDALLCNLRVSTAFDPPKKCRKEQLLVR
ncbi:protein BPS1, chloroplastic-like [Silene latifolia]|uniref:protein BPS1, chloroplastic-like n=1 Tax=Silene latifolia TaxID=37657 RepID=UPI003D773ECB